MTIEADLSPPSDEYDFSSSSHLVTRAEISRLASASKLTGSVKGLNLQRQYTRIHSSFPEVAGTGITLYYCSGWKQPNCHYKSSIDERWTTPPGHDMFKSSITDSSFRTFLPNVFSEGSTEVVWAMEFPGAEHLEFVTNDQGSHWDKPCHGGNYIIELPGRYLLRNGCIHEILPPPERPALLEAKSISASSVSLVWNGPLSCEMDILAYQVFRDDVLIATVDSKICEYEDKDLLGLVRYTYIVKAVNKNEQAGDPSDPLQITTGEPDKPSEVTNLRVSDHSESFIELSWQRPHYDGGGIIQLYRIYRDGIPLAIKTFTENKWEAWQDITVQSGESYIYHVTACRHLPPRGETQQKSVPTEKEYLANHKASRLASFLNRLPSMPARLPPEAEDVSLLTEYLVEAVQHRSYEGLVSAGVKGEAVTRLILPRINDGRTHVIMQGFNWHSCENKSGHYNSVRLLAEKMKKSGVTMLWLPPPTASVSPQGYMPNRYHDLNTAYGTKKELHGLIEELRRHDIAPMLDCVANHRCGVKQDEGGDWTIFEDPDWGNWAIVSNNLQKYRSQGRPDTGASSQCAPDIDHTNETVRRDIKEWITWLFNDVDFASLRIDMAPGYATKYQIEYVSCLGNPFTVGEYWSGDTNVLQNYINSSRGLIAAYDFALYYVLRRCVESGNFSDLNQNGKVPGLTGRDPQRSVTFIDNHDTVHLDFVGKFAGWNRDAVLRGCVYLLTHPGTPCLYWDHFVEFGECFSEKLMILGQIRHEMKIPSQCGIYIVSAYHGLYAAYISRDPYCRPENAQIAVKLGDCDWSPPGNNNWKIRVFGNGFCVWTSNK